MHRMNNVEGRRRLLKAVMSGGGLVASYSALPQRWVRPAIDSVVLPAHAQTTSSPMFTFPSSSAEAFGSFEGSTTVGATEGSGAFFDVGDFVEQTLVSTGICSLSGLDLSFSMLDGTFGCAEGAAHTFDVLVNGTTVGSYFFTTPTPADAAFDTIMIAEMYSFGAIAGQGIGGDNYTIRIVATSAVCSGGGSYSWISGGSATLNGTPC